MKNPERFVSEPGDLEAQTRIDTFFDAVLDEIGYDEHQRVSFCEVRSREIALEGDGSSPHFTDDRITELLAKSRTVAIALSVRDDWNYTQVMLASFLSLELIAEIK